MISSAGQYLSARTRQRIRIRDMLPERAGGYAGSVLPAIRGSSLGSLLGALPGERAQPSLPSLPMCWKKRLSPRPESFGKGAHRGRGGSPNPLNNAAAQTAFIPTLTLGIPGSATMALILGALN